MCLLEWTSVTSLDTFEKRLDNIQVNANARMSKYTTLLHSLKSRIAMTILKLLCYLVALYELNIFIRINIFFCHLLSALSKFMGESLRSNYIGFLGFSLLQFLGQYLTLFIRFYISDNG